MFVRKIASVMAVLFVVRIEAYRRSSKRCDDVAIIGAGIAGTYSGWRLRHLNQKITIYEYSDRVGGRCYTLRFPETPDINVEMAAARFVPKKHKLLYATLRELGLQTEKFIVGKGPSKDTTVYVRGEHLRHQDLGGDKTPYKLHPNERKPVKQLQWEMYKNYTDVLTTNVPEDVKHYYIKDVDGIEMYKQSVMSMYNKFLTPEAQKYIAETSGFDTLEFDISAAVEVMTSPPSNEKEEVLTVSKGFQSIPTTFLERFLSENKRHNIKLNHHLKAIRKSKSGIYNLYFEPTITRNGRTRIITNRPCIRKCAKKVILAVNRLSLERLQWQGLYQPHIREYITKAVKDASAGKYYLSYNSPWWRNSPFYADYVISDTPLKQTYDFGTSKTNPLNSLLQPMYTDVGIHISYWKELVERENGDVTDGDIAFPMGKEMVHITNKYLSHICKLPLNAIPQPISGVISLWDNYPYGGAWQEWMPGYIWTDVEQQMTKPSKEDDVFVVSNAFNSRSFSYWTDGALQAVELAMPYFGLKSKALD
ncbi:Hypothetical predicted protein [Mytilus galloprovincialis]|uniref:Amine oxidase domain-containing protein n=1 Tax=Mytilus galloprovincialis TaxID=29158 RepID=A0A8B6EUM4_MYTGA|nr:Hypothetical predicted protein [Mytilus galloprovincialis]